MSYKGVSHVAIDKGKLRAKKIVCEAKIRWDEKKKSATNTNAHWWNRIQTHFHRPWKVSDYENVWYEVTKWAKKKKRSRVQHVHSKCFDITIIILVVVAKKENRNYVVFFCAEYHFYPERAATIHAIIILVAVLLVYCI